MFTLLLEIPKTILIKMLNVLHIQCILNIEKCNKYFQKIINNNAYIFKEKHLEINYDNNLIKLDKFKYINSLSYDAADCTYDYDITILKYLKHLEITVINEKHFNKYFNKFNQYILSTLMLRIEDEYFSTLNLKYLFLNYLRISQPKYNNNIIHINQPNQLYMKHTYQQILYISIQLINNLKM